ncbi:MAG: radical SAM protein [Planctomycetota bacterium]
MPFVLHPPPRPPRLQRTLSLPQWAPSSADSPVALRRTPQSIGYLRLSVTRGCSMRCTYCRPGFDRGHDPAAFDADDFAFLAGHLHRTHGLRKVRITGGEPTTRRDLRDILERVAAVGVPDLAVTTNGLTLARDAARLRDAGLGRVNVSLDTLDPGRFERLTGVNGLERVIDGIDAARAAFAPRSIKLNMVVVAGQNEADLPALLGFAAGRGLPLRLIELMPMGPIAAGWQERYVPETRMRAALAGVVRAWRPAETGGAGPDAARRYVAELRDGRAAEVGFITPMSRHFCDTCDRLRVTADGSVYPCLMDAARGSVADAVRGRDGAAVDRALAAAYARKADVHPAVAPGIMTHLGG